ncbi:MAG: hypothetical protein ACRDN9_06015 [Streptosporangiaceae bacterium]
MWSHRLLVSGALSVCLLATVGAGQAVAATGGSSDSAGRSGSSGPLTGLTDSVSSLVGGEHGVLDHAQDPVSPRTSSSDSAGPAGDLVGSGAKQVTKSVKSVSKSVTKNVPHGGQLPTDPSNALPLPGNSSSGESADPGGGSLPLPAPGDSVPNHLCLPDALTSSLPSSIPTCLDLTTCKEGLLNDLATLPKPTLTDLVDYVERVLVDLPACLLSLLPTGSPSSPPPSPVPPAPKPPTHARATPPAPQPPPTAKPAKPVRMQPNFTG